MKISARNQLRGVVDHVHIGDVMTEVGVRLAGGDIVVSAITTESRGASASSKAKQSP
jgi:molybdate transport system regulatory protein